MPLVHCRALRKTGAGLGGLLQRSRCLGGLCGSRQVLGLCGAAAALIVLCLEGWAGAGTAGGGIGAGSTLSSAPRKDLSQYLASGGKGERVSAVSLGVTFRARPSVNVAVGTTRYGGGPGVSTAALWQVGSNSSPSPR